MTTSTQTTRTPLTLAAITAKGVAVTMFVVSLLLAGLSVSTGMGGYLAAAFGTATVGLGAEAVLSVQKRRAARART